MFLVGVTGGIGTGKTTVSDVFRFHNIPVIDADIIAREVVAPKKKAWYKLRETFGPEIFHEDDTLNREALGDIIFSNAEKRRLLNEITHPEIVKEMAWLIIKCFFRGYQYVVLDLPLLFETAYMLEYLYKIIVVTCEEDLQLQRVMERQNISESRAIQKISVQMPLEWKCERAHYVVENSGTLKDTTQQVVRIIENLNASKHHWKVRIILALLSSGIFTLLLWVGIKLIR